MAQATKRLSDITGIGAVALVVAAVGLWVAFRFVEPAPPSQIEIASGQPSGAYAGYAERYRTELAKHGIDLQIRETAGSGENLELLRAGEVDIAFVQGGVVSAADAGSLQSLGSVAFEPLWVFYRGAPGVDRLSDLQELRIAAGDEGSGTRAVALELLRANQVAGPHLALSNEEAVRALRDERIDAAFFVASPDAAIIRELLTDPNLSVLSFARATAYGRNYAFLSELTLPEGVIDLATDVPPHDVSLVSPTANLVIGEAFHPALVDLMLQAAVEIHGGSGVLSPAEHFPTPHYRDLPLSAEAQRFYQHGPPFLQRYLPFWMATLVDRLKVMLIPLIALLIPLVRLLPPVYRWRVRSRIYRWYSELATVEPSGGDPGSEAIATALKELARIEHEVAQVPAPASYSRELYDLRVHVGFVRAQLERRREELERA